MYKRYSVSGHTRSPRHHMGKLDVNVGFYMRPVRLVKKHALPMDPNHLRQPKIDDKFKRSMYINQQVNFTDKDMLDVADMLRHPRERDFYQDHTYHNEWIQRDLNAKQKKQLSDHLQWMLPGYEISPWIWFPGDTVEVVSGEFAGQRGTILNVVKYKNQAFVQNVNVKPIVIPASETRPEQTIQREHAVNVATLKIVDPSTNEPCEVRLVTVRDKETGEKVERRMSLSSGTLLPLPKKDIDVDIGDPLHDTPMEDAQGETYMEDKELPVMVARKLRAMEDHFVGQLQESYVRHEAYRQENVAHLRRYQQEVVRQAAAFVMEALIPTSEASASPEILSADGAEAPVDFSVVERFVSPAEAAEAEELAAMLAEAGPVHTQPHWAEAADGVELPEFTALELDDLHGVLDVRDPRRQYAV